MPEYNHLEIGRRGEDAAREHLCGKGMECLAENWSCRAGELDLIMRDGQELVFVEVKTRLACAMAEQYLFANITADKQRRLRRLAQLFLAGRYGRGPHPRHRIDVVGVVLDRSELTVDSLKHLVGVV